MAWMACQSRFILCLSPVAWKIKVKPIQEKFLCCCAYWFSLQPVESSQSMCVGKEEVDLFREVLKEPNEVLQRVQAIWPKKVSTDDTNWFQNLIVV
uniref:Uncharacterized protein n=1 Tax=Cannabis sativa TaxID=3483 RepID=A0A803PI51_CANSA